MKHSLTIAVKDMSHVGGARRTVDLFAEPLEFDATRAGQLNIIVTELATNLVKHAGGGELVVRHVLPMEGRGIEVLAIDRGPGISNWAVAERDGYSTAGSPGNGLGALRRLATLYHRFSLPGNGSVVSLFFGDVNPSGLEMGAVCLPVHEERTCGDAIHAEAIDSHYRLTVADGLGHGEFAAEASNLAIETAKLHLKQTPQELMATLHTALRATRGAAAAAVTLDPAERKLTFAGVGNIAGTVIAEGKNRGLVSTNGIVGHQLNRTHEMQYPWPENSLVILTSDGINTRWKLEDYPGLMLAHPSIIAAILYRDFRRERDDTTVMVVRG